MSTRVLRPSSLALFVLSTAVALTGFKSHACRRGEQGRGQTDPRLLVAGGCCHDYKQQKDILTKGISARANVQWKIAYDPDTGTKHLNPVYEATTGRRASTSSCMTNARPTSRT